MRQQHIRYQAETRLTFEPQNYQQAAGLITYYNRHKFHALLLTADANNNHCLTLMSCPGNYPDCALEHPLTEAIKIATTTLSLRVEVDGLKQRFLWRESDAAHWQAVGPRLNAAVLSDEGGRGEHASFTGTFVGMVAFDVSGQQAEAGFDYFNYTA